MAILTPILLVQLHFIFIKIMVALDSSYFKTYNTIPSSSFCTVYCQRYSALRLLVTDGGHLEFSHEKVDGQNGNRFFQSFWVNISEKKKQLFKIYIKKAQNDTMTYTSLRDGAISNNHRFTVTTFERRSTHTASSRSVMSYRIMTG